VHRVLRDDGTLWLNLGDSYAGAGGQSPQAGILADRAVAKVARGPKLTPASIRPKDLIGIPWRVAFALQADGWYLRQDIIWHKPNPMPESVRDRCTKAHEYLFMLSKSERYHFDSEAIKEPAVSEASSGNGFKRDARLSYRNPGGTARGSEKQWSDVGGKRNRRSVWTVATRPFKGAHFATFPPDLIEPCVLAGCPVGGVVLDPFGGAGTTGLVAQQHGRRAILCELNPEYVEIARARLAAVEKTLREKPPANGELFAADAGERSHA
jgi:DNA modification methylase